MIRQGLVRRVFGEWQRLCQERDWKTQLATRDNEIKRMDREVCQAESVLLSTPSAHISVCAGVNPKCTNVWCVQAFNKAPEVQPQE